MFGSPGTGRGGRVPGSPRSGLRAESCEGPQPDEGLLTGSQPGIATANDVNRNSSERENSSVKSIVSRYLGKNDTGAAAPGNALVEGNPNEDAMSVSSICGSVNLKRSRVDQDSDSDSDFGIRPPRVPKVLRSKVIGSESGGPIIAGPPIVLSDSSDSAPMKARGKKSRARHKDVNMDLSNADLSADLANLVFTHCPSRLVYEDVANRDADDLAITALGWLDDMKLVRTKSKKMNGRLSGCLKDRIAIMRSMIRILVERVKDSGDISYLR